jgi:hypothetical protein
MRRTIRMVALSMLSAAMMLCAIAMTPKPAGSQEPGSIMLYTDPATGQVFTKRCKRCIRLGEYVPAGSTEEIERKVERRTQAQLNEQKAALEAEEAQRAAQQQQWNAQMAQEVGQIQPFAQEFGDRWYKKISVGTLFYGYYGYWSHTGFGPQFLDANMQWPGPGNNSFNEFAINRTYIDMRFTPVDDISFRLTPDMYAMINTGTTCTTTTTLAHVAGSGGTPSATTKCTASSGDKVGTSTGYAQTDDGNLGLRLKYAYLDYNTFFQKVLRFQPMNDDRFTFGQQQNPLVDWEENLWGFRYTALTPWNYLSLSSAQVGVAMKGPIKLNEIQYADYDFGVYDDASYHALEQSSYKQVMGRVTINPFGAHSRYDSFGITGFYDYGYKNTCTPDSNSFLGANGNATCGHLARAAALGHYNGVTPWGQTWGVIAEWDYGHNAFSSGNLYSGSGPSDAIGIASPSSSPFFTRSFGPWNTMVGKILNSQDIQEGADLLGHIDIPYTPFTAFGLLQWFQPNTRVDKDPLDFTRYDVGVQWLINKYLRVAFDSQAIQYYHSQFTYDQSYPGLGTHPTLIVPYAVPRDTHAFFLNLEFRY